MSQTNTRKDRDLNGRLIRRYKLKGTRKASAMVFNEPSWWVNEKMTRPRRRAEERLCKMLMSGVDPEGLAWPPGNRKPHEYYW